MMGSGDSGTAVLIVEDEPSVAAYVKLALERHGYVAECAQNGSQAVEMLQCTRYRGVISDMRTPGEIDGAGLYDWVTGNCPLLAQRWVFITGDTVNQETSRALERTGAPYIEKPFRVGQLIDVVRRIIGEPL